MKEGGGHIQPGIKECSSENKTKAPISNMVIRWGGGASYSGTSPERGARVQQREARQPGPFLCSAPAGGEDAVTCVRACVRACMLCHIALSPARQDALLGPHINFSAEQPSPFQHSLFPPPGTKALGVL